jgi:glutamine synthetase
LEDRIGETAANPYLYMAAQIVTAEAVCEPDHTPPHVIGTTLARACDRCRATLPRGPTMSERAVEEGRSWTSDVVWVAFYSILVLLLMLMWVNVPA